MRVVVLDSQARYGSLLPLIVGLFWVGWGGGKKWMVRGMSDEEG